MNEVSEVVVVVFDIYSPSLYTCRLVIYAVCVEADDTVVKIFVVVGCCCSAEHIDCDNDEWIQQRLVRRVTTEHRGGSSSSSGGVKQSKSSAVRVSR